MPTRIGIISDTHMPLRCERLPDNLPQIFADVDLILHAGDVGELWVLDELSRIAPVIAVHGNDETEAATAALPFHQTLMIEGWRIVLNHGARRTHEEEMEMRKEDRWQPKFDYFADFARQHGGQIYVYGHSHIPMVHQHQGVWLINAGALAPGGLTQRQLVQTVAIMTLQPDADMFVTHHDLNNQGRVYVTASNWDEGFHASYAHYGESIFAPDLAALVPAITQTLRAFASWDEITGVFRTFLFTYWRGERPNLTLPEFGHIVATDPVIPARFRDALARIPELEPYFKS